jgi:hypothetical protein
VILTREQREALETVLDYSEAHVFGLDEHVRCAFATVQAMLRDTAPPVYIFEHPHTQGNGDAVLVVSGITPIHPNVDGSCARVMEHSLAVKLPGLEADTAQALSAFNFNVTRARALVRQRLITEHEQPTQETTP